MNNIKSGLFIKEKRNEKNLTQKELAEKLNCTDKAISRWETGKGFPEVSFLIPLSETLDVSVNEIILGESIEKEQIVEKADDVLVETIKTSNKKINNANIFIFALLLVIEFIMFYIIPLSAGPGDEMAMIFANVTVVIACSFLVGFVNLKVQAKLIFSPLTIALFVPSSIWVYSFHQIEYTLYYSAFFAVSSLVLIFCSAGIQQLIIKLHNVIKK